MRRSVNINMKKCKSEELEMRKRLNEISAYEVFLSALVVMIHVLSEAAGGYAKGSVLSAAVFFVSRAATFVVPAFIISSGIKFANKFKEKKLEYGKFILSRLKKIYLPYAAVAAVYYLYFVFRLHYFDFNLSEMLHQIMMGTAASPFYFIVIIMQFYITAPLWLAVCRRASSVKLVTAVFALLTAAAQYFLRGYEYGDRVLPCYMVYWILGCCIGMDFDDFISGIRARKGLISCTGVLFTVLYSAMAYAEFLGLFHSFLTELVKLGFSLSASVMYLALMPQRGLSAVKKLAPVTYYIYLIHCLVLTEVNFLLDRFGIVSLSLRLVIRFIAVYAVSVSAALLYKYLKNLLTNKFYKCKI